MSARAEVDALESELRALDEARALIVGRLRRIRDRCPRLRLPPASGAALRTLIEQLMQRDPARCWTAAEVRAHIEVMAPTTPAHRVYHALGTAKRLGVLEMEQDPRRGVALYSLRARS